MYFEERRKDISNYLFSEWNYRLQIVSILLSEVKVAQSRLTLQPCGRGDMGHKYLHMIFLQVYVNWLRISDRKVKEE